jgi:hypothetical protein
VQPARGFPRCVTDTAYSKGMPRQAEDRKEHLCLVRPAKLHCVALVTPGPT